MKYIPIIGLLFTALTNCHSDKAIEPVDLSGCSDKKYSRAKPIEQVATIVIAKTHTTSTGSQITNYYLDQPDVAGFTVPWAACNLPDAYKKDQLAVRITGYVLTYPGMENENSAGNPIELTRIETR